MVAEIDHDLDRELETELDGPQAREVSREFVRRHVAVSLQLVHEPDEVDEPLFDQRSIWSQRPIVSPDPRAALASPYDTVWRSRRRGSQRYGTFRK